MHLRQIIQQLHEVFDGDPWFGNSLSTYLQEVGDECINFRVAGGHSIGQIIAHMIVWREYVIDQLQGIHNPVEVGGTADWQKQEYTAADKSALFARFKETQKRLTQLLEDEDDRLLQKPVLGKPYTFEKLLIGIVQHDIYHLGQIYLLKTACQHTH